MMNFWRCGIRESDVDPEGNWRDNVSKVWSNHLVVVYWFSPRELAVRDTAPSRSVVRDPYCVADLQPSSITHNYLQPIAVAVCLLTYCRLRIHESCPSPYRMIFSARVHGNSLFVPWLSAAIAGDGTLMVSACYVHLCLRYCYIML